MLIAIVNASKLVSDTDVQIMTLAVQTQLNLHVAPAWNQKHPIITFYTDKTKIPGHAWVVNIVDTPDVANALGYHSEDNDKIDAFIFCQPVLDNGGVVLYDASNPQNTSIASVLSHEVCEMFGDRFVNFWANGPKITQGDEYALELCDPVESDSYEITVTYNNTSHKVSVSNFIFPSWFNQQATSANMPFDYLKKLNGPFKMSSGGYMVVRTAGREQQVFGETMPEWKKALKQSEFYRR